MNEYKFQDVSVGLEEQFQVTITEDMMTRFRELTGDTNPMHIDMDYAQKHGGMKDRIVYGMLSASFYSTLVGMYLPGKYALFEKCEVSWPSPCYIGDRLTVIGRVSEINSLFSRITIKAYITNQYGKKISRALLTVGFTGEGTT